MKDKNIGFIGLGNVGSLLANRLIKSNLNLYIYDINKKSAKKLIQKGAIWKKSIEEVVINSSIIITCLPSPKIVKNVVKNQDGLLRFVNKNHLWIEMSTTDEKEMVNLSKLIQSKGANVIEAPISGGQHKAESGNISILVGGNLKCFKRAFPVLSKMGHKILHCGKLGNASTLKVVTNYLASINLLSLGEALMVCKKYGINLNKSFKGIKISSGNSFVHETESKLILNGSFNVGFTMDLVCKDVGLFDKLTQKLNIPVEISPLMVKIFNKGKKQYGKRSFSTSIVKLLEEKCKTKIRSKGFPSKLIDFENKKKGIII